MTNWQTYCICDGKKKLRRLPSTADPEVEIGAAGGTALTAYCGLIYDGKPKANDTILISAAAGGTGLNAGFIAKAKFPNCTIVAGWFVEPAVGHAAAYVVHMHGDCLTASGSLGLLGCM